VLTSVQSALFGSNQVGKQHPEADIVAGNIEPITPIDVYERTLGLREARRGARFHTGRTPKLPLTGRLVRCGTCGGGLLLGYNEQHEARYFCRQPVVGRCDKGVSILARRLVPVVEAALFERLSRLEAPAPAPSGVPDLSRRPRGREGRHGGPGAPHGALRRAGDLARGVPGARDRLREKLSDLEQRKDAARRKLEETAAVERMGAMWADLGGMNAAQWAALDPASQREIYGMVLISATVHPLGSGKPRVEVQFRG
jgi:hypothetical protein